MMKRAMDSKTYRWIGIVALVWMLLQILPVTRIAFNPVAVQVRGDEVVMQRTFPGDVFGLPRPRLSYVETVRPITQTHNNGHPCADRGGPFRYSRAQKVGRWRITDWAGDCLSDPTGYVWSSVWTWHIGNFEVGPARLSHRVIKSYGGRG
ncbi:hypothetical protein [Sediminimonas sp.]|uniref:hypothetical protein n=1 Tax=Sediminimonas sp. TaxID=2823379 RepID=UPI0025F394DD|nr:hypothetical protein [Sediminimonas sp.]